MMKSRLLIVMMLSILSAEVRVGFSGGAVSSTIWGKKGTALTTSVHNYFGYDTTGDIETTLSTNLTLGLTVEFEISLKNAIITGINYVKKGLTIIPIYQQSDSQIEYLTLEKLKQKWLEIPILFNHNLFVFRHFAVDIQGGVWGAFLLNSTEYNGVIEDSRYKLTPLEDDERMFTDYSRFDFGFQTGVPLSFTLTNGIEFSVIPSFSLGIIPQIEYQDETIYIYGNNSTSIGERDTLTLTGGENQFYDFRVVGEISFPLGKSESDSH